MSDFFEFTESGVKFKGFQDLRSTLAENWKSTFGNDIDLTPSSPDGHHVDLEARTISSVAEGLELLTTMLNRNQATGQFLDMLAAFLGLSRNENETDDELRKRMDSADNTGLATYDEMLTYLRNAIGNDVSLAVNDSGSESEGVPAHSFRVSVPLANTTFANDIAKAIWHCKPAGIPSSGNSSGTATDASGYDRVVYFSRPADVPFCVSISVSLYREEQFPSDGVELIEKAVREWCSGSAPWNTPAFRAGTDIIPTRFFVPVLSVGGIQDVVVKVRKSSASTWTGNVIAITPEETAVLDEVEVKVV